MLGLEFRQCLEGIEFLIGEVREIRSARPFAFRGRSSDLRLHAKTLTLAVGMHGHPNRVSRRLSGQVPSGDAR